MNGSRAAEKWWDSSGVMYVRECDMPDIAWEYFLEDAAEHEPFLNEDGEWLEGYPSKLDETKEWAAYCDDFCSMLVGIQDEVMFLDIECGGDLHSYYGVRRSDFA